MDYHNDVDKARASSCQRRCGDDIINVNTALVTRQHSYSRSATRNSRHNVKRVYLEYNH